MTYDLHNPLHLAQFLTRCSLFQSKGATVELREVTGRSKAQNRYLYLILGVVAMETGNTVEYTKEIYFKRLVNPDIFVDEVNDKYVGTVQTVRSTAGLQKETMSKAIDRFKRWAAENGIYIPDPEDAERLKDIEMEMGRMKSYL
jgi:hypothetical protein